MPTTRQAEFEALLMQSILTDAYRRLAAAARLGRVSDDLRAQFETAALAKLDQVWMTSPALPFPVDPPLAAARRALQDIFGAVGRPRRR